MKFSQGSFNWIHLVIRFSKLEKLFSRSQREIRRTVHSWTLQLCRFSITVARLVELFFHVN